MSFAVRQPVELFVPSNCEIPAAANTLLDVGRCGFIAEFEFRHAGETAWEITFNTDDGTACLAAQRNALMADGHKIFTAVQNDEYRNVYSHFDRHIPLGPMDIA